MCLPGAANAAAVLDSLAGQVASADDLHAAVARGGVQHWNPGRHLQHLPALRVQVPVVLQQSDTTSNFDFDPNAHDRIPLSTLPKSFKCSCTPLLSLVDVRHI